MKSNLEWFKELLLTADPNLTYAEADRAGNYTTWIETMSEEIQSDDDSDDSVWTVYVDRYTKNHKDKTVKAIKKILAENNISFVYEQDYESDTRYFHHIFTCYIEGHEEDE